MIEAMDTEIGRLLVEAGLATRTPDGQLDYHPEATNTMVIIVGDNGSYLQTVRLPFNPQWAKGTPYQTGVWVPLIVAGSLVDQANVGSEVQHIVNAAVDVYQLFGEIAGIAIPDVTILAHDASAVRDDYFKLVRKEVENCATNQLGLQYEFYTIDDAAPVPKLDIERNNLIAAPTLPPQSLTPDQQQHFDVLLAELLALLRSEPACPGDGNLDKRVNQADVENWQTFAGICASGVACTSVYDLTLDGVTDSADLVLIQQNFGRHCGLRGFLR
jgi:arylsulfatase A-like enzyme